jgi:gluconokinase
LLRAVVIMGVSGVGKSTLGRTLADRLGYAFIEGDDLHPSGNIAKMSSGVPLEDADRWPWLERVADGLAAAAVAGGAIAACSALKLRYRDFVRERVGMPMMFIHPDIDAAELRRRLASRSGHFMPTSLLDSQFAALERPDPATELACVIDATLPVGDQAGLALAAMRQFGSLTY